MRNTRRNSQIVFWWESLAALTKLASADLPVYRDTLSITRSSDRSLHKTKNKKQPHTRNSNRKIKPVSTTRTTKEIIIMTSTIQQYTTNLVTS
ncbi:hypothetical protein Trydic_g13514 [Trypoxylus dichotomus]